MGRYDLSEKMLERAQKTIPLGTQTFSKSKVHFPLGVSPYYIKRGEGSRVWDIDGNEYIDFINSLAAVTLGYNDPDVTTAVQAQLKDGTIFSLPHVLEVEVSELLTQMIPCAEMVRYGKNGSDATSGAIRVARAYTHRDRVAVCGYHGWQDWYIGSTPRNKGVPQCTSDLTHSFRYNDIQSLHTLLAQYPGEFAAVIMEPMNLHYPQEGFLEEVKALAHSHGALFIFDETVTGFRLSNGGAQELFGVTPDLATFGKGLANGYPVSAVVGKEEYMKEMEEIFFSFTFGGELLSLAAAKATMQKLLREPVLKTMKETGQKVLCGVEQLIQEYDLGETFSLTGHPAWSFLVMQDTAEYSIWEIKTLFLQEMYARGILTLGTHNMNYAHGTKEVDILLNAYRDVFLIIKEAITQKNLDKVLRCKPLEPLFKVR